jgi:hypothetical protein
MQSFKSIRITIRSYSMVIVNEEHRLEKLEPEPKF